MNIKNSVLDYIRYKQLNLYDHVQRMNEERLPQKYLEEGGKEDLEICVYRRLQQEWETRELTAWNGLTENNGEEG